MHFTIIFFVIAISVNAGASGWQGGSGIADSPPIGPLNSVPQKYADKDLRYPVSPERFSKESIRNKNYIDQKVSMAKACRRTRPLEDIQLIEPGAGEIDLEHHLAYFLGDTDFYSRLEDIDTLREGSLEISPWSGDYWAISKGVLGARPFDALFRQLMNWFDRYNYQLENSFLDVFNTGDEDSIRNLSASEKYDLLVGPHESQLTDAMWNEGKRYYDRYGKVESWMGICHGWAVAAYMTQRPSYGVWVKSFDNESEIYFYPDEIKGLASYAWANNQYASHFVGRRCNKKNPKRDENGRIIDPSCFDSNPATWHIALTHLVGRNNESFVMDATYDYEVWNQPVYAYDFEYFNINTGERTESLVEAKVKLEDVEEDKFQAYRSPKTSSIIGIVMKIGYVVEASPRRIEDISNERARVNWVRYVYDLEIDSDDNIIGGEWHSRYHPDFLYRAAPGAKALTENDRWLDQSDWEITKNLPKTWKRAAVNSSYRGQVLYSIVEKLIEASNGN